MARRHPVRIPALILALLAGTLIPSPAGAEPLLCFGKRPTIFGTPHDDKLIGTPGNDVIVGLGGEDRIRARSGDDRVCGGGGPDSIRGGKGNDQLNGGRWHDVIYGNRGDDRMLGRTGFDYLSGGLGNDLYDGGGNRDQAVFTDSPVGVVVDLSVESPQNTNEGIDTIVRVSELWGSDFDDILRGRSIPGPDGDFINGWYGSDQIFGGSGDDSLHGDAHSDEIHGGDGDDVLMGDYFGDYTTEGDDEMYGGAGDDTIVGGFNLTDPPDGGDLADGGSNITSAPGDTCLEAERTVDCETLSTDAGRLDGWSRGQAAPRTTV